MARAETGHIHLGSSILHHTEGWETKSVKKKKKTAGTHRNTGTAISTPARMHAHKQRKKKSATALPLLLYRRMQPCSLQSENLKDREYTLFLNIPNPTKILQTHARTHNQTHDPLSSRK